MKTFVYKFAFLTGILILSVFSLHATTIFSTTYGGLWNSETSWIGSIIPGESDTAIIQGPIIVGHVVAYDIFHSYGGWVIVEPSGTLSAHEYGGGLGIFFLYLAHDITNYGTIQNGPEYLHLEISGDLTNYGIWQPHKTILNSVSNQNITLGDENDFGGYWQVLFNDSITALSDIRYSGGYIFEGNQTGDFDLGGSTLFLNGFSLNTTGTVMFNGAIEGNFEILGVFDVNKFVTDTLRFIGNVTVTDTLQSQVYGGGLGIQKLLIEGNIINNGVVRDREDTDNPDELNIIVTGNITNNGKWTCNHVNLIGTETQTITQSPGTKFDSNFYDLNAASDVKGESDIYIGLNFDLNGATLNMQNHTLIMDNWLHDGFIENTILQGAYLQNITSLDNLTIEGLVTCDAGNVFQNSVVVNDTLEPNVYGGGTYTYILNVDGTLTNNGVIRNGPGDYLKIHITGDLFNKGSWVNFITYLNGTEDQNIYLLDDATIEGSILFDAVLNNAPFQWYYEGAILDSPDFNGETSQVLSWNVAVQQSWYGTYYCETGEGNSRNIIVRKITYPAINLNTELICTSVELSWEMTNGSPDSWNVYRNDELIANVELMSYTDVMLIPDEVYSYYVTALYGEEESEPSSIEVVEVNTPENLTPEDFVALADVTLVNCTWSVPTGCLQPDGYNLYRNGAMINTSLITTTDYSDTPGNGSFEYFVKALYYFGDSGPSAIALVEGLAIDEWLSKSINIYPNPTSDFLNISSDLNIISLRILNKQSQLILEKKVSSGQFVLELSNYSPGLYILLIKTDKGTVSRKISIK